MDSVRYFLWLSGLSLTPVVNYRYVTVPLLLAAAIGFFATLPRLSLFCRRQSLLLLIPPASGLLMLLLGTLLRPTNAGLMGTWPARVIWAIFSLNLPLGIFAITKVATGRFFAFTLVLLGIWLALWCAFFSGMSIIGIWVEW